MMKAVMVMFDSLNRRMLPPYGCDWAHAPNFQRLAESTVTFDNCFIGSMPCMPARRELHTDPGQEKPIHDREIEAMMIQHLVRLMQANDAPC